MTTPRVFTIPQSLPFLPTLIRALADGRLAGGTAPDHLADATLYLPTRRACALARGLFLDVLDVDAAILPRIVPLGDIDEDELAFADLDGAAAALDILPALDGMERRFLLARLVLRWAERNAPAAGEPALMVAHPAAALGLADDLARLMDDLTTREVPWSRLDGLVPEEVDEYWQLTLKFLKIIREAWPALLAERGRIEPAARRDRLIAQEAARLAADMRGPVIAAGSTGSMPATAKLLAAIAVLPRGAVVLPGLDMRLDEDSWNAIPGRIRPGGEPPVQPAVGHPQFAMRALLDRMNIMRREVVSLSATVSGPATGGRIARETLLSEALRPAASTELWHDRLGRDGFGISAAAALADVTVIAAANQEEEALAIAVALREALVEPGRTAALVTPDRTLARRVAVALGRWNIPADDSAGVALGETAAGVFARLIAQAALGGLEPASLLAVLKHPLARLGVEEFANRRAIAALERAVLRGPRPRAGTAGLAHAFAGVQAELAKLRRGEPSGIHRSDPRGALDAAALEEAADLIARLTAAIAPLEAVAGAVDFARLAERHRDAVLAASLDPDGIAHGFSGADGAALAAAFDDIAAALGDDPFLIQAEDYPEMFRLAIEGRQVRPPETPGHRVRIYGLLEARLTSADRVVVGSLVETVWPPDPRLDPWLSRPMRQALGLDLPERRIGLAAHDFAQALGAAEVFLTFPAKRGGTPTVVSRFVQRLAAVAGAANWQAALTRGERYRVLANALDHPNAPPQPVGRPEPRPPRLARPMLLSVTEIEHWLRDPYTIYAKHILRLAALPAVDEAPSAAERGTAIHAAIGDFAKKYAGALPPDPAAELLRIGRGHFAHLDDFPEARAFWWPQFERIVRWFVEFEKRRRPGAQGIQAEIRGELRIPVGGRDFRLIGRADRIESLGAGGYAILDFKTGTVPSGKQVQIGVSPQLTLEAAMLRRGGFAGAVAGSSVAELTYVRLKGGEIAGEERPLKLKDRTPDMAADESLAKLAALVTRFDNDTMPYRSLVMSMWSKRYGAYDELARVKEWSQSGAATGAED